MMRAAATPDGLADVSWKSFRGELKRVEADANERIPKRANGNAKSTVQSTRSQDSWYEATYDVFIERAKKLSNANDFSVVAAFAYSWAATIPTKDPRKAWGVLGTRLQSLRDPQNELPPEKRGELLTLLTSEFTGEKGIIMASKILHFIAPTKVPIVDSRVALAWNATWKGLSKSKNEWVGLAVDPGKMRLAQFVFYWAQLDRWRGRRRTGVPVRSYREIERRLFDVGRKLAAVASEERKR